MPTVYLNREAFPFKEYFRALDAPAAPPDAIFVASDSNELGKAISAEHARRRRISRKRASDGLPPLPSPPPVLTVPADTGRFVALYGSHTVAAGASASVTDTQGSQHPSSCLPSHWQALACARAPSAACLTALSTTTMRSSTAAARRVRRGSCRCAPVFSCASDPPRAATAHALAPPPCLTLRCRCQVMYEAAEDLWLLAGCTRLAATASSRYGAIAAMLVWARTGGAAVSSATTFLDGDAIASGELQNAWLHWSSNGTNRSAPGARWRAFSRMLPEGVWPEDAWEGAGGEAASATIVDVGADGGHSIQSLAAQPPLVSLRSFLPVPPPLVFWVEALRGLGGAAEGRPRRFWPGECPVMQAPASKGAAATTQALAVVTQINGGVQHLELVRVMMEWGGCQHRGRIWTLESPLDRSTPPSLLLQDHLHQAYVCWREALRLLRAYATARPADRDGSITDEMQVWDPYMAAMFAAPPHAPACRRSTRTSSVATSQRRPRSTATHTARCRWPHCSGSSPEMCPTPLLPWACRLVSALAAAAHRPFRRCLGGRAPVGGSPGAV